MSVGTQRRLAAIVSTDVVGYSRLMGRDERGTLEALKAHRAELIDGAISEHGGRVVKTTGDGMLLEFPSVVAAVECCVAVQEGMANRNADVPADEAIQLRIGIHLGDVIAEGDDVFGDGVNIAARLQEVAAPGGIAVSSVVHDYLDAAAAQRFVDLGERSLKNIRRPIRIWQRTIDVAAVSREPFALPDRPSIAVLPFDNMSGDPDQEFFADGIAEDIITALSRFRSLFVIARNSTFTYKGQAVSVAQVGRELGVRYVVEGSVRKAANRVRITAQLIDATTGNHVWADRYDRELDDIFAVQDEITQRVCAALEGALTLEEQRRARLQPPQNLDAWAAYHLGRHCISEAGTSADSSSSATWFAEARTHFERSHALDANFARPLSAHALVLRREVIQGVRSGSDSQAAIERASHLCERAIALDPQDGMHRMVRGMLLGMRGDWEAALSDIDAGIELNPNSALGYLERGQAKAFGLWPKTAVADLDTAFRLSPLDALLAVRFPTASWAHLRLGEYENAAALGEKGVVEVPSLFWPAIDAAAAYVALQRMERARELVREAVRRKPELSSSFLRSNMAYLADPVFKEWFLDCLRQVGLPED